MNPVFDRLDDQAVSELPHKIIEFGDPLSILIILGIGILIGFWIGSRAQRRYDTRMGFFKQKL